MSIEASLERVRAAFNAVGDLRGDEVTEAVALMVMYNRRDESVSEDEIRRIIERVDSAMFDVALFSNFFNGSLALSFPEGGELQIKTTAAGDAAVEAMGGKAPEAS